MYQEEGLRKWDPDLEELRISFLGLGGSSVRFGMDFDTGRLRKGQSVFRLVGHLTSNGLKNL